MVVWHLFPPCKVCLLAIPVKESVFAMDKLNGELRILSFRQFRDWGMLRVKDWTSTTSSLKYDLSPGPWHIPINKGPRSFIYGGILVDVN